jgi:hypothetical protein
MSVRLTTYVGPMIKIPVTDGFNVNDFCYETSEEQFYNPDAHIRKTGKYWFLLPNRDNLTKHSYEFCEDEADDECDDPLLNPDIPSILKEFSSDTASLRELIPVPHEVVWGVYTYWS